MWIWTVATVIRSNVLRKCANPHQGPVHLPFDAKLGLQYYHKSHEVSLKCYLELAIFQA